ncbi:acetyl-CoA carboxylase biotin carboxylase subunit [Actinoplanes ianthinogenes]|uniref:biotin carboxylase n=1 Tax=Actinoplanes ianthinogenes TaxID=122358 RepID=A0ABN6CW62_9ACTN|nr:acetyl-CoA carboxylase biotin carboxylase subunit [Actinoplanes ianthinogenes]BCJ48009.1 acetyl-CoA carboxylase biotin carboxylase subunit [Actinoplanes ianthinogenes]GGR05751.1 acetyl-CoA carboxylase biotin carboxylase subunit [Actinoplanes ianthinogenes]
MFATVLIANRGEIALRVVRTCREMGIRTVVAHSTADRDSAAVRAADAAVQIGPAAPKGSYLSIPAVIEAARAAGAQAVHPGYGFLSEDADFAEVCAANDLVFIGPPPEVMARLGDKAAARREMASYGLPVLPGSAGTVNSLAEAAEVVDRIGYPVIIKAAAGGGGRGMSVVRSARELGRAYRATRAAAQAVFGDGRVYLERFCDQARHVEVQVLADRHGTVLHLGERDCSVQRRHQKLVEEAPAPNLPDALRAEMAAAAVAGARAAGYVGAGTFEFLVADDGFHFMEINCRIQVEHPVTEMVTGLDLVREQIRIAAGLPLKAGQHDVRPRGVALECRVNAEDPAREYAPAPGTLDEFVPPGGPFTRVDTHGYAGWRVTSDYDSLLAKVIVWAPDRLHAIARMRRALAEFRVAGRGVRTTIPALDRVLDEPDFIAGVHGTDLLSRMTQETP